VDTGTVSRPGVHAIMRDLKGHMTFAKSVFIGAGVWGFLVLVPLYFMFESIGRQNPPPMNHREFYYGFLSVALTWQVAFFVIGSDPARFRLMMIPAALEKFGHVATMSVLFLQNHMTWRQLAFNLPDLLLGTLFVIAFFRTKRI